MSLRRRPSLLCYVVLCCAVIDRSERIVVVLMVVDSLLTIGPNHLKNHEGAIAS
jgi:hypothetical protein